MRKAVIGIALISALLAVTDCSRSSQTSSSSRTTPYLPPPVPTLTSQGLPPAYETCVQRRAQSSPDMYQTYLDCHKDLVFYVVQLDISQEAKADRMRELEPKALNRSKEVTTAIHGSTAVAHSMHGEVPPDKPSSSADDAQMKQWASCSVGVIVATYQQGAEPEVIVVRARGTCGHLWSGDPAAADRLYSKILASVRAGISPGYVTPTPADGIGTPVIVDRKPVPGGDMKF